MNWTKCNCEHCIHAAVCAYSEDVQYFIESVEESVEENDGTSILSIDIGCKYYYTIDKDEESINPYQE